MLGFLRSVRNAFGRRSESVAPAAVEGGVKPRLTVVAWDMGHNPTGRAHLIADLGGSRYDSELIGPLFKAYGDELWEPLRGSHVPMKMFRAERMADFLPSAVAMAAAAKCDAVVACKPRLPSILIGLLIKHRTGCPLVIDVDDHELSFFKNQEPLAFDEFREGLDRVPRNELELPYSEVWTRMCEALVPTVDATIVSNVALQGRFGGSVVRHARNEAKFALIADVRARMRKAFGFTDQDKLIVFVGTVRAHKGLLRLAEAMARLNDPRLVLAVFGTIRDRRVSGPLESAKARIKFFPDQPFNGLPDIIAMADAIFLLQQPEHPISKYQIPAKLTDAIATTIPVITTIVEPMSDIPDDVVQRVVTDADIDTKLRALLDGTLARSGERQRQRDYFMEELSYATNSERVCAAIDTARARGERWNPVWTELFRILNDKFGAALPVAPPAHSSERGR